MPVPSAGLPLRLTAAAAFLVVATLNAGGYRYGASDQAFYIPAVLQQLDPSLFPRDRALLAPQARVFLVDEIVGEAIRATGWSIETWFAILYVVTVLALAGALWALGQRAYRTPLAVWTL
ncbi:MAG: hypothetical protein R2712_31255, partial [Vicinamibacterales bacterium]